MISIEKKEVKTMDVTEVYKILDRFESTLPTDCGGCEVMHGLQTFVIALTDRFDRRCNDHCDSRCVACGKAEGGAAA